MSPVPVPPPPTRGIGGMDVGRVGTLVREATPHGCVSAAKQAVRGYGQLTAASRPLPDYLILGTKKGGTTSLANWLVQHPGVLRMFPKTQRHKSAHYFDSGFDKGLPWYRSHFPGSATRDRAVAALGYQPVVGEASPYYMFHPAAPDRVRSVLPDAKLIMLLRDPVARAHSHYWDRVNTGFESLPTFEEAIAAEPARLADLDETRFADPRYQHFSHEHHSYLARGRYAEQLARWQQVFAPDQLLVLEFERMRTQPQVLLAEVLTFLDLPLAEGVDLRPRNARNSQPPMSAATSELLRSYYRPHNDRLAELLGRDLSWTKS